MPTISKISCVPRPRLAPRKRVAAYARVSMETDLLLHSLSAQVSHFSSLIQGNAGWEYVGVYADSGVTGTSTEHRDEFKRLLADCDAGLIDIVLAKSISRFARDTVDCLKAVRHLKDGELLLTLLASFAQAESDSISANVKWATRKRFAEGIPNGHKATFGYSWDGEMFRIIPEQGEIVKQIFERYLAGESGYSIAKALKKDSIVGQSGGPMAESTIKDILSNPAYTGTMVLQKNYFTENHVRKKNRGELPQYAVEGMFEPLVSKEDFERAQIIRQRRAEACPNTKAVPTRFSGLMKCGNCGCGISRRTSDGKKRWVCNTRERKGMKVCGLRPLSEAELEEAAETVGAEDDEAFRRQVKTILVYDDHIEFILENGKVKTWKRK